MIKFTQTKTSINYSFNRTANGFSSSRVLPKGLNELIIWLCLLWFVNTDQFRSYYIGWALSIMLLLFAGASVTFYTLASVYSCYAALSPTNIIHIMFYKVLLWKLLFTLSVGAYPLWLCVYILLPPFIFVQYCSQCIYEGHFLILWHNLVICWHVFCIELSK